MNTLHNDAQPLELTETIRQIVVHGAELVTFEN
jgi:hypothetical protein